MGIELAGQDDIEMRQGSGEEVVMRRARQVVEGLDLQEGEVEVAEGARGRGIRKR